jgi:hypothetical protein
VIREQLGMTPVRYYRRLDQLRATEETMAYAEVTVNRLQRIQFVNEQRSWRADHSLPS